MTAASTPIEELPRIRKHLPALDGVRGLALLMVLIFHGTLLPINTESTIDDYFSRIARIGWCGVDLFFVLSGFLITGILLDAKGSDRYFTSFYGRRLVRIFPLYYACLLVAFYILPAAFKVDAHTFDNQWWYWAYLSNILHAVDPSAMPLELSMTWTLAVEEQFYLLWPAVVFFCSRRTLMRLCIVLVPVVIATRVALRLGDVRPEVIYSLTICRFDTLAIGALVAALVRGPRGVAHLAKPAMWLLAAGFVFGAAMFIIDRKFDQYSWLMQTAGYTALSLLFGATIVLVLAGRDDGWPGRFWRHPLMRLLGKHSYAMYLIHMPLKREFTDRAFGPAELANLPLPPVIGQLLFYAAYIGLTLALSIVIWHVIEKPFLRLKKFFPYDRPQPAPPPLVESTMPAR